MTIWERIETLGIATHIGETWWFPLLESIHVVAATFLVGSLLMVDLRLMHLAATRYPVRRLSQELIPWTWFAFAVAATTGVGLFATRASHYIANVAMQAKFVLLLLAGVNMLVLHFLVFRDVERWEAGSSTSGAAKLAGATSLALWAGILLSGRWIGHLS